MLVIMNFEEFEKEWMKHFDGFVPVYSSFEENTASIEVICHWRLHDGPYKSYRNLKVTIDNKEQLQKIKEWLIKAADWWKGEMLRHSERFI